MLNISNSGVKNIKVIDNSTNEISFFEGIEDERIKTYIKVEHEKYRILEDKYKNLKKVVGQLNPINVDNLIENNLDLNNVKDLVNRPNKPTECVQDNSIMLKELLETLNKKFLNGIDINLLLKNGLVINKNTSSIIFDTN